MKGIFLLLILACFASMGIVRTEPLIIDHDCTNLSVIPMNWIDSVQAKCRLHYAHTSHGQQLLTGVERIELDDERYSVNVGYCELPTEAGAFRIFNGQESSIGDYITPDLYWQTHDGMNYTRDVLHYNPTINYSMWCWCTQLDSYTESDVQEYLDSMQSLEAEFPLVQFIYFIGNAQATDADGWNRNERAIQIRNFCISNNKVLYDFADLDSWFDGEQHTYTYGGDIVPAEHPHYYGDESDHTTFESCENKGRAFWWMMACLVGCPVIPGVFEGTNATPTVFSITTFPNPFNSSCKIVAPENSRIEIFDLKGNKVADISGTSMWKPAENLHSGIYSIKAFSGNCVAISKVAFIK
jgi:hypothetical protein